MECKCGINYSKNDIKSFKLFKKTLYKFEFKAIISNTDSIYKLDEDSYCLPLAGL